MDDMTTPVTADAWSEAYKIEKRDPHSGQWIRDLTKIANAMPHDAAGIKARSAIDHAKTAIESGQHQAAIEHLGRAGSALRRGSPHVARIGKVVGELKNAPSKSVEDHPQFSTLRVLLNKARANPERPASLRAAHGVAAEVSHDTGVPRSEVLDRAGGLPGAPEPSAPGGGGDPFKLVQRHSTGADVHYSHAVKGPNGWERQHVMPGDPQFGAIQSQYMRGRTPSRPAPLPHGVTATPGNGSDNPQAARGIDAVKSAPYAHVVHTNLGPTVKVDGGGDTHTFIKGGDGQWRHSWESTWGNTSPVGGPGSDASGYVVKDPATVQRLDRHVASVPSGQGRSDIPVAAPSAPSAARTTQPGNAVPSPTLPVRSAKAQRAFTAADRADHPWLQGHGFDAHPGDEIHLNDATQSIAIRKPDGTVSVHKVNGNGQSASMGQVKPENADRHLADGYRRSTGDRITKAFERAAAGEGGASRPATITNRPDRPVDVRAGMQRHDVGTLHRMANDGNLRPQDRQQAQDELNRRPIASTRIEKGITPEAQSRFPQAAAKLHQSPLKIGDDVHRHVNGVQQPGTYKITGLARNGNVVLRDNQNGTTVHHDPNSLSQVNGPIGAEPPSGPASELYQVGVNRPDGSPETNIHKAAEAAGSEGIRINPNDTTAGHDPANGVYHATMSPSDAAQLKSAQYMHRTAQSGHTIQAEYPSTGEPGVGGPSGGPPSAPPPPHDTAPGGPADRNNAAGVLDDQISAEQDDPSDSGQTLAYYQDLQGKVTSGAPLTPGESGALLSEVNNAIGDEHQAAKDYPPDAAYHHANVQALQRTAESIRSGAFGAKPAPPPGSSEDPVMTHPAVSQIQKLAQQIAKDSGMPLSEVLDRLGRNMGDRPGGVVSSAEPQGEPLVAGGWDSFALDLSADEVVGLADRGIEFAISADDRRKAAQQGHAMSDGSYPIRNPSELKSAIGTYPRGAGNGKTQQGIKRHIIKRARKLRSVHILPASWNVRPQAVGAAAEPDEELIALLAAAITDAPPQEVPDAIGGGVRFRIPIVLPSGVETGDRRKFSDDEGALEHRDLPLPLLWQKETDDGHKKSVIVARIDKVKPTDNGLGEAEGEFDTGPDAQEALRLVRNLFLRGVSGDVDKIDAEMSDGDDGKPMVEFGHARLTAATLVPKPAFAECMIELPGDKEWENNMSRWKEQFGASDEAPKSLAAAGGPVNPPRSWFENPDLDGPTHLQVTDDGRVFGHIAAWSTNHISMPFQKPPRSKSGYKYFTTGQVKTAEGDLVDTGALTLQGGHADLALDAAAAIKHYDDTLSAVADVAVGEDEFGIWVAGAQRPDLTEAQVRSFRAADPSGDWRPIDGTLELVGTLMVNVPGFPIPRAKVASGAPGHTEVLALVAAGAPAVARRAPVPSVDPDMAARLERLESAEARRQRAVRAELAATLVEGRRAAIAASAARLKLDAQDIPPVDSD